MTGEINNGEVTGAGRRLRGASRTTWSTQNFREAVRPAGAAQHLAGPPVQQLDAVRHGSRELGTNNRLRWTFHPLGELFVVYNHNVHRVNVDPATRRWLFVSNELPVKIQYAYRF